MTTSETCGNCYRSVSADDVARTFVCSRCAARGVECAVCTRIARERALRELDTCATCSIDEEQSRNDDATSDVELADDFAALVSPNELIAVLPLSRAHMDADVLRFPGNIHVYGFGINVESLNIQRPPPASHAGEALRASGVTERDFVANVVVAFPFAIEWSAIHRSHDEDLATIRALSAHVDRACLDLMRYLECPIEQVEALPARAGQLARNSMMAGALLFDPRAREARILGGAAFTHWLTRGLGLPLVQIEPGRFPRDGEVGNIARHGLALYSELLQASSETSKFVQCLSLLEFLAFPNDFENWKKVKRIISRYVAKTEGEYAQLLDRFVQLTGGKDAQGVATGYRTCIVHLGKTLEDLIPVERDRRQLFIELQGYIRAVLDHMIVHSEITFAKYEEERATLAPFLRGD
jgi:hypothetical protein